MASYLCVKMNSSATKSYNIKSSANKPYLRVDTGFIPLTTATATGPKVMVRAGGVNYRLADFITTTTVITTGTSYLTSQKTTGTSYETASRASTSDTGYETRSSASSTGYLTRSSTSATGYLTRSSTSSTGYLTRASTYSTTYTWRSSTSATTYATRASTSSASLVTGTTSLRSGCETESVNDTKILDDCRWEAQYLLIKDISYYTRTRTVYTVTSTRGTYSSYGTRTVTNTEAVTYSFLNTTANNYLRFRVMQDVYTYTNGRYTHITRTYNLFTITINGNDYKFGSFYVGSYNVVNDYRLVYINANESNFNHRTSKTASGLGSNNTIIIDYQFPNVSEQYVHHVEKSNTYTDYYYNGYGYQTVTTGLVYTSRYEYSNMIALSATTMQLEVTNKNAFFIGFSSFPVYSFSNSSNTSINAFKMSTSSAYIKITGTSYLTRASTSATGYKTRQSTSKTGYLTRSSTSATTYTWRSSTYNTTYATRASTSSTTYATRSSTSATTYATRSSQYTSNTSYLTQPETYQTSYITTSAETTMEG